MADPFVNVDEKPFAGEEAAGNQHYQMASVAIGNGVKSFRGDDQGIWLGAEKFVDAPFSVTMEGVVTMTSGTITGYVEKVGGTYSSTSATAAKVQLLPSSSIGIVAYASDGTTVVFKVEVGGSNVGDVTIGNYAGGQGMLWDQSAGILRIKGNLEAGSLSADRLSGGTIDASSITIENIDADNITSGTIGASRISVSTLSAITSNMGTLTAGTISAGTIILSGVSLSGSLGIGGGGVQPTNLIIAYSNLSYGANAYLRFGHASGSRIWADSSDRIGINSLGNPMYIYVDSTQKMAIPSSGQITMNGGVYCDGNLNTTSGTTRTVRVHTGYLYVNTTTSPSERLWVGGSAGIEGNLKSNHHDPRSHKSYNLGGDSIAWDYVYADDYITKSAGWYDEGVEMQDGEKVSDMEGLRRIKPHKRMRNKNGSMELDFDSLPTAIFRRAIDRDTKKPLPRNKDGDAINPETGEVVGDGVSLTHLVSVMLGALKEVDRRLMNIEKGIK